MDFLDLNVFFLGNACGYMILVVLLGTVRDRMQMTGLPEFIKGTPVIMVITGLIGFAFLGLVSLLK
jgi:Na+-translocating ferredoxin:NAD+ oxidoreductase RnfA subunit